MSDTKPVIFLAFANNSANPLPQLAEEYHRLEAIWKQARQKGHCEVIVAPYATVGDILATFQDACYRGRIVIFHYAGHADSYHLLLQDADNQSSIAHAGGLAAFLGHQHGLQLVFLNGCSTQPQAQGLLNAGVAAVIATSQDIDDQVATDFAADFYDFLVDGDPINVSFEKAQAAVQTRRGSATENLYTTIDNAAHTASRWPWDCYIRPGAEKALRWNLPDAANDPLFGLPSIPEKYYECLPDCPFRGLTWFATEHATLFWGRGYQIRELYQQITAPHAPPLLLFYGQSGVGKSSLLAAGLTPRLEASHTILYLRRGQQQGLLGTLQTALFNKINQRTLADAWVALESRDQRPLLVILDQAEEVFTRPNLEQPRELADFLAALQTLGADPAQWPQGKLILSFRKEWLAEIKRQVEEHKLPHSELFLQRLDRRGVIEAIAGPTLTPELQAQYRLAISAELPGLIADDLLADPGSAVAPILQILLTKLWEAAKQKSYDQPVLDPDLYAELRKQGLGLGDILDQQIAELGKRQQDVVDSGLALDLLAFHTTPLGTAEEHTREELRQTYAHRQEALDPFVQECDNLYLLVDPARNEPGRPRASRLAHDTLAPLVRRRFAQSDASGQRARRILENRAVEWQNHDQGATLDVTDLVLVESGQPGMRAWTLAEQKLVTKSREAREQRRKWDRLVRNLLIGLIIMIILAAGSAFWQWGEAQEQAGKEREARVSAERLYKLAMARQLAAQSSVESGAKALLLSLEASRILDPLTERPLAETNEALRSQLAQWGHWERNLLSHTAAVRAVTFGESDDWIFSAAQDSRVTFWNLATEIMSVTDIFTKGIEIRSLAFDPERGWLALGTTSGQIHLLNAYANWREIAAWQAYADNAVVLSLAFGPNVLVSGSSDFSTKIWSTTVPAALIATLEGTQWMHTVAISPDGRWLASGGDDSQVRLWDWQMSTQSNPILVDPHMASVRAIAISQDGRWLASGGDEGTIHVVDLAHTKEPPRLLQNENIAAGVQALAFVPQTDLLIIGVGGERGALVLADVEQESNNWQVLAQLDAPVESLAISPSGDRVVTGDKNGALRLWQRRANRAEPQVLAGHTQRIRGLAFAPRNEWSQNSARGRYLVSISEDESVRIWSLADRPELSQTLQEQGNRILAVAVSPDGQWLATGGRDHKVRLRLLDNLADPPKIMEGHNGEIVSMAFSPDGNRLITGSADNNILLWNMADLTAPPGTLKGHKDNVLWVAVDSSGELLASGDQIGFVYLWNLQQPDQPPHQLYQHSEPVRALSFSPSGRYLISGSDDGTVHIAPLQGEDTGQNFKAHEGRVRSVAFSPDGQLMATAGDDQTIKLWNPSDFLQPPIVLRGHHAFVRVALFSPDGQHLASAGDDQIIYFWTVPLATLQQMACDRVGRNLTNDEWRHYFGSEPYRQTCVEDKGKE